MNNKYQEALNWFQEQICAEKSDFCKSIKCCPKECSECSETKYYKTLQELIDKSTPKKFKKVVAFSYMGKDYYNYQCPCCNEIYDFEKIDYDYCPYCSQKIDWSDYV